MAHKSGMKNYSSKPGHPGRAGGRPMPPKPAKKDADKKK